MSRLITLVCPSCKKRLRVPRQSHDYPEATEIHLKCEKCSDGDFDEPVYFDVKKRHVNYDPKLIHP